MPVSSLSELRDLMRSVPSGKIPAEKRPAVTEALKNCWDEFDGSDETSMVAFKLDRTEDLVWDPPSLCLKIARHGGTAQGSTREEIHQWQINLDEKTAEYMKIGHRQVRPMVPKLTDAELITKAISVSEAIKAGPGSNLSSDFQLTWISPTECRIKSSALIPGRAPKQTVAGRRKRMREILQQQVKSIGWVQDQRGSWIRFTKADTPA